MVNKSTKVVYRMWQYYHFCREMYWMNHQIIITVYDEKKKKELFGVSFFEVKSGSGTEIHKN